MTEVSASVYLLDPATGYGPAVSSVLKYANKHTKQKPKV